MQKERQRWVSGPPLDAMPDVLVPKTLFSVFPLVDLWSTKSAINENNWQIILTWIVANLA